MLGLVNMDRAFWIGIMSRKSWLLPNVDPFSFSTPITLNLEPLTLMVLSIGFSSGNNAFCKSLPITVTALLFSISKTFNARPFSISKPEFSI